MTLAISPIGNYFVTTSKDKQIRVFDFKKGKLILKYDESVSGVYQNVTSVGEYMDSLVLGRRIAMEKELEANDSSLSLSNIVFDETGSFIIYGSLAGIKILNIITNKVVRVLGSPESSERFLALALYQGIPKVYTQFLLAKAGTEGGGLQQKITAE